MLQIMADIVQECRKHVMRSKKRRIFVPVMSNLRHNMRHLCNSFIPVCNVRELHNITFEGFKYFNFFEVIFYLLEQQNERETRRETDLSASSPPKKATINGSVMQFKILKVQLNFSHGLQQPKYFVSSSGPSAGASVGT